VKKTGSGFYLHKSSRKRSKRKTAAVVANGRLLSRADLDRILSDVEAWARSH